MRRILAMLCICAMVMSTIVWAAGDFPDLPEGHWAYTAVDKMVNDGRVNGFPDGEFKPDNLVTRWQFAKMAGGNPDAMTDPDRDATRDEAVLYLWERAGKPVGIAPGVITKESDTPEAVAWAYSTGIMQGDDGLNLRLDSTLSRAEAACLIVRAEQELHANVAFKDTIKPILLERIWDAMQTGIAYEPEKTITNGELARLALQIAGGVEIPTYLGLKEKPKFTGAYAKDVQLVSQDCWGMENATEAFMNEPVTMQNAVAALSFYTMKQATGGLSFNQKSSYDDATLKTPMGKLGLHFANYNGIFLTAQNQLDASRKATIKDLSCILLQLDELVGLSRTYGENGHSPILKQEYPWPSTASQYAYILEEIPSSSYETPLMASAYPVDAYDFARDFAPTMADFLSRVSQTFPDSVRIKWTLYPSLVAKKGNEAVIRARLEILDNPEGLTLNQIIPKHQFTETYTGNNFLVDITTGNRVGDVVIDIDQYQALRAFVGKD